VSATPEEAPPDPSRSDSAASRPLTPSSPQLFSVGRRLLGHSELDPRTLALSLILLALWVALDAATDGLFLTPRNLSTLAVQTSVVGIMATGMVLLIVARQIDLSVGSLLGLIGMIVAALQVGEIDALGTWGWPAAVVCGLVVGAGIGCWQGYWVAHRRLPAFVVTLAGLLMFRGAAYLIADGRTIAPLAPGFELFGGGLGGSIGAGPSIAVGALVAALGLALQVRNRRSRAAHGFAPGSQWVALLRGGVLVAGVAGFVALMNAHVHPRTGEPMGIPVPVLVMLGTAAALHALARRTPFGRWVFAIGGNPEAALRAGIDVRRVVLLLFVLMGGLAALASVIATARLGAGTNSLGTLTELSVIAAAVIGGASLAGGVGTVFGALLGALIMQSLESGMVLLGVSSAVRQIAIGGLLLIAVWADGALVRVRGRA